MYPKAFFDASELVPSPGTCFLVMPFAKEFDAVCRSIKRVLEGELGLTCVRTDELLGGGNIIEDILRGLATSELVVVDMGLRLGERRQIPGTEWNILFERATDGGPCFRILDSRTSAPPTRSGDVPASTSTSARPRLKGAMRRT